MLVVALSFTACKSDDDGGTSASANGELTAKVDGQSYESMREATTAEESNAGGVSTIAITGGSADSENIQFIIIGFDGEGTYQLNNIKRIYCSNFVKVLSIWNIIRIDINVD